MSIHDDVTRREFLAAAGALTLLGRKGAFGMRAPLDDVLIVEFGDDGRRQGAPHVAKIVKTDAEWRKQLTSDSYYCARQAGTERPFSGAYWNLHDGGVYRCICCGTALFSSAAKFDAGTGWPSYWQPIAEENVHHGAPSSGFEPSPVLCRRCDAHLGDLFDDGPRPTGLRYCIDSVALHFVKFS